MRLKALCIILVTCIIMSFLCMLPVSAAEPLNVRITVRERNGIAAHRQLIKRGIPVKAGTVFDINKLKLTDASSGQQVDCVFEIMEYNDDNSASWISAAFLAEATANETKEYIVTNDGTGYDMTTDLTVRSDDSGIELSNDFVKLTADQRGINGIYYRSTNILNKAGVESYTRFCSKNMPVSAAWKILEQNPLYATVRVTEVLSDKTEVEWDITLVRYSKEFITQARFIVKKTVTLDSEIHRFNLLKSFSSPEFSDGTGNADGALHQSSWAKSYNSAADISFYIVSEDVEKFKGAMGDVKNNGFANPVDSKIEFAPIQYNTEYSWVDGQSRSIHFIMGLCKGEAAELDTKLRQRTTPLSAIVDPQQFVEGGIVEEISLSPVARRQIDAVLWLKDKRYARVDAGAIPFGIEKDYLNACTMFEVRNGETDYNFWFGQIMSGNEEMFDIMNESAWSWADIIVNRGGLPEFYGVTRRRTFDIGGHPYYGDMSGLYLSYLMTGNIYYRELFKLACDWHRDIAANSTFGAVQDGGSNAREIRYVMMVRALYYGYKLFRDERYLHTAKCTVDWAKSTQDPGGYFPQYTFYDSGQIHSVSVNGQHLYKNYLTLYGMRGVCTYYEKTEDADALDMLVKFADYLLGEIQEDGWMWDPMADKTIAETGEDYSRGLAPMQEIMSTEIMDTVFRATGDTRYLEGMLRQLRYYIAAADPCGLVAQRYNDPGYLNGQINGQISAQPSTYLRILPRLRHTMEENMNFVLENGYEDLYYATDNDAGDISSTLTTGFPLQEFSVQSFTTPHGNYVYMVNKSGKLSGIWNKNVNAKIADSKNFYIGSPITIKKDGVYAVDNLNYFNMMYLREIPVRLTTFENSVSANVREYDSDRIVIDFSLGGSYANFEVLDGDFDITDGKRYSVNISGTSSGKTVTVTQDDSGKYTASNGRITFKSGSFIVTSSFEDTEGHWALDAIEELTSAEIIKGVTDTRFAPEDTMTTAQFAALALRTAGIDTETGNGDWEQNVKSLAVSNGLFDDTENVTLPVNREKAADILVKAANIGSGIPLCDKYGISRTEFMAAPDNAAVTGDPEAVRCDAELLCLQNSAVANDITLPQNGYYGTTITWTSSNEAVLSPSGKVTRPAAGTGDAKVTLTATVEKGAERLQKSFDITVLGYSNVRWTGKRKIEEGCVYDMEPCKDDVVNISFEAYAGKVSENYYLGFAGDGKITGTGSVPILLRFRADGLIDAVNGNGYTALEEVGFKPDTVYKFNITADLSASCYDAYITLPCGKEIKLAEGYSFNTSAPETKLISKCFVFTNRGFGEALCITAISRAKYGDNTYRDAFNSIFMPVAFGRCGLARTDSFGQTLYWHSLDPETADDTGTLQNISVPKRVIFVCEPNGKSTIHDICDCSEKYAVNILTAYNACLINGTDTNEFKPLSQLTRAEGATMIKRLADHMGFAKTQI